MLDNNDPLVTPPVTSEESVPASSPSCHAASVSQAASHSPAPLKWHFHTNAQLPFKKISFRLSDAGSLQSISIKLSAAHWITQLKKGKLALDLKRKLIANAAGPLLPIREEQQPKAPDIKASKWDMMANLLRQQPRAVISMVDEALVYMTAKQKDQLDGALASSCPDDETIRIRIMLQSARIRSSTGEIAGINQSRSMIRTRISHLEKEIQAILFASSISDVSLDRDYEERLMQLRHYKADLASFDARQSEYKSGIKVLRTIGKNARYAERVAGLLLQKAAVFEMKSSDIEELLEWIDNDDALGRQPNILKRVVRFANCAAMTSKINYSDRMKARVLSILKKAPSCQSQMVRTCVVRTILNGHLQTGQEVAAQAEDLVASLYHLPGQAG